QGGAVVGDDVEVGEVVPGHIDDEPACEVGVDQDELAGAGEPVGLAGAGEGDMAGFAGGGGEIKAARGDLAGGGDKLDDLVGLGLVQAGAAADDARGGEADSVVGECGGL